MKEEPMARYAIQILGLLALLSPSAFAVSYQYDALHRLTKVTYDNGVEITYDYDAVGNRTARTLYRPLAAAIAHWTFDEGSGGKAADSAGKNDLYRNPYGAEWTTGKIGNALWFDGVDDWAWTQGGSLLAPSNLTISLWVNPEVSNTTRTLIGKAGTGFAEVDYRMDLTPMNRVTVTFGDQNTKTSFLSSNSSVRDSVWTHVTFTRDGSESKVWINGTLDSSQAYDFVPGSGSYRLTIGQGREIGRAHV
jgi:YD repeat-containing protein